MEFNEYQTKANQTAIYYESITKYVESLGILDPIKKLELIRLLSLTYAILGLANEAGEVAGVMKKIIRDGNGQLTEENLAKIDSENGDVNWYNAEVATNCGTPLNLIVESNLAKLESRKERGVIQGSGDNR